MDSVFATVNFCDVTFNRTLTATKYTCQELPSKITWLVKESGLKSWRKKKEKPGKNVASQSEPQNS